MEERYLNELKTSRDWPQLSEKLGDLRSRKAVVFFLGNMARAMPGRIGLPERSEAEDREFRRQNGNLFEGSVMCLITMKERMGDDVLVEMVAFVLEDREESPETRSMAADTLADCRSDLAEIARAALLRTKDDPDPLVRTNVEAALKEVDASRL